MPVPACDRVNGTPSAASTPSAAIVAAASEITHQAHFAGRCISRHLIPTLAYVHDAMAPLGDAGGLDFVMNLTAVSS